LLGRDAFFFPVKLHFGGSKFVWLKAFITLKTFIFWYITLCSQLKVNLDFGGTHHLCLPLPAADFFLGLLLDPENGGDMFL
jgi:hypothetical protein